MPEEKRLNFEEALKKLENIVARLEDDSISLEESIDLFEEGTRLSSYCSEILENAELRIQKVNEDHVD